MIDAQSHSAACQNQAKKLVFGHEGNTALIIDNFHPQPHTLIQSASEGDSFIQQRGDFYPGKRKVLAEAYRDFLRAAVEGHIRSTFKIADKACFTLSLCAYSLTTTPPHKLRPIQQIPHIDTHEALQFAVVHYICSERFRGTSFYRHRSSGFETVNEQRLQGYFAQLKSEVLSQGTHPPRYIRASSALFEMIAEVELKFNRAVIYPSNVLHSGNIEPHLGLSSDPRQGRLTINSFVSMR